MFSSILHHHLLDKKYSLNTRSPRRRYTGSTRTAHTGGLQQLAAPPASTTNTTTTSSSRVLKRLIHTKKMKKIYIFFTLNTTFSPKKINIIFLVHFLYTTHTHTHTHTHTQSYPVTLFLCNQALKLHYVTRIFWVLCAVTTDV